MARAEGTGRFSTERLFHSVRRSLSVTIVLISLWVLGAWAFGATSLLRLNTEWIGMKLITAASFVSLAFAILMRETRSPLWARLLTFIPIYFALQSMADLFELRGAHQGPRQPMGLWDIHGHMGFNTALCFLLLSLSLLMAGVPKGRMPLVSQLFAFVAAFIAFFAVIGYVFDVEALYRLSGFTAMGLPTALLLLMLTVAVLFTQFDLGPMSLVTSPTVGGYAARRLILGVLVTNLFWGAICVWLERDRFVSSDLALILLVTANVFISLIWISRIGHELNNIEARRRGTERLLKEIINTAPAVIYVKNLDGNLILANAEFETQVKAVQAHSLIDTAGSLEASTLDAAELKVLRTGERLIAEETLMVSGEPRTFVTSRFPIYDEHDRMIGISGVWTDITSRKQFEEKLRQSEEGLRTLADTLPSIVWTAREDGTIDYLNRRWIEYTGESFERPISEAWQSVIDPQDFQRVREGWLYSVQTGLPYKSEARMRRRDGMYRWHLVQARSLKNSSGQTLRWFGSITDIDDQKRQAETLERRVAERTKELISANRELEAFSYSVSHDLRAPLRSMDGFSEILLSRYGDRIDETGRSYLQRVRSASRNMATLIDDLLTLSRIGRTEMVKEPFDLSSMARDLFEEKRRAEPDRLVRVEVESGLMVHADESLLRIALWNLIDNAWKYTSKTPNAVISFSSFMSEEGMRVFKIQDNGAGFDMVHAKQLFKAFQRLHSADEFPGTGIGLATAYRIIARHGGTLWAESEKGKGSSFYFNLGDSERKT